ncbi:uncharacterized protein LOC26514565 isoform X2 [Drosophila ananassae]|uniref:uncharacterized protein LOC26514565 isoform X2 n=1 Tax=Drosophila ananassae TaxID=7217 RepID=UPI0013A5C82E|nr:uncharacterized protein LOC26514565 isoform X2 [Drosophila ananassae]
MCFICIHSFSYHRRLLLSPSGGICVDENWKNDTVWNVNCIEWMLIKDGEKDVCVLPWRCCPTAHYEKSISY